MNFKWILLGGLAYMVWKSKQAPTPAAVPGAAATPQPTVQQQVAQLASQAQNLVNQAESVISTL